MVIMEMMMIWIRRKWLWWLLNLQDGRVLGSDLDDNDDEQDDREDHHQNNAWKYEFESRELEGM